MMLNIGETDWFNVIISCLLSYRQAMRETGPIRWRMPLRFVEEELTAARPKETHVGGKSR